MDPKNYQSSEQAYRQNVFDVLHLIASKKQQLDYQKQSPYVQVSAELFNQWDDFYQIGKEQKSYEKAFKKEELKVLKEFDDVFDSVSQKLPQHPPDIHSFIQTPEWLELSSAAEKALRQLKTLKNQR